jgi:hypothetical protein
VARTLLSASLQQFSLHGGLLGSALVLGQELKPATKIVRSARFSIPLRKAALAPNLFPSDLRSASSTFLYICGKITAELVTMTIRRD